MKTQHQPQEEVGVGTENVLTSKEMSHNSKNLSAISHLCTCCYNKLSVRVRRVFMNPFHAPSTMRTFLCANFLQSQDARNFCLNQNSNLFCLKREFKPGRVERGMVRQIVNKKKRRKIE